MKNIKVSVFAFLVICILINAGSVHADAAAPSPELIAKGKALFNDKAGLGVKFACIMCHKQEKAVKLAKIEKEGDKLPEVVNKYIVTKSKGTAIAADSEEMKALIAYMKFEHAK